MRTSSSKFKSTVLSLKKSRLCSPDWGWCRASSGGVQLSWGLVYKGLKNGMCAWHTQILERWRHHIVVKRMLSGCLSGEVLLACVSGRRPQRKTQGTLERLSLGWPGTSWSPHRSPKRGCWGKEGLDLPAQAATPETQLWIRRMDGLMVYDCFLKIV